MPETDGRGLADALHRFLNDAGRQCEEMLGAIGFVDAVCALQRVDAPGHHALMRARLDGEFDALMEVAHVLLCRTLR